MVAAPHYPGNCARKSIDKRSISKKSRLELETCPLRSDRKTESDITYTVVQKNTKVIK